MPVAADHEIPGGRLCQEDDQHSQSAKRNTRDNRNNGTKQSAGISGNKRKALQAELTRWPNCGNTLQSRQRSSILAQMTLAFLRSRAGKTRSVELVLPNARNSLANQ